MLLKMTDEVRIQGGAVGGGGDSPDVNIGTAAEAEENRPVILIKAFGRWKSSNKKKLTKK